MKLSEIVKDYRRKNSLSMEVFAQRCHVTKAYISMIERDNNNKTGEPIQPKAVTLGKLANGMGMSINTLLRMMDDGVVVKFEPPKYSKDEINLILNYRQLNPLGKKRVKQNIEDLLKISDYAVTE